MAACCGAVVRQASAAAAAAATPSTDRLGERDALRQPTQAVARVGVVGVDRLAAGVAVVSKSSQRRGQRWVVKRSTAFRAPSCAMSGAAAGDSADDEPFPTGPIKPFPRIGVRDPYKRLGLTRDASTEEITEAKNYLLEEYRGHERSREAIEEAFDRIIAEKFRERKKTKINLKADLKKKVAEAPPWIQGIFDMVETPKRDVLVQRSVLFLLLAAWSIMNPAEGGPAFQVAVALGLSVYLINDRLKSIGRAFLLGFGSLVVGWIAGSFIVPFVPDLLFPVGFWSLELGTALVAYIFLWFATTFLK